MPSLRENKEKAFYEYIVKKFGYPHPAYSDYDLWVNSGRKIRPLLLIIKTLVFLFESYGFDAAYLTSEEVYRYLQPLENEDCSYIIKTIHESRSKDKESISSDNLRKINEMMAFLAIAGFVYIDSYKQKVDKYRLNLISVHPKEKTFFFLERTAGGAGTGTKKEKVNVLENLKKLWTE